MPVHDGHGAGRKLHLGLLKRGYPPVVANDPGEGCHHYLHSPGAYDHANSAHAALTPDQTPDETTPEEPSDSRNKASNNLVRYRPQLQGAT